MKTSIKTLAATAALMCVAAPSIAQSGSNASFTGWGLGAGLSVQNSKIDFSPSTGADMASTDTALDLIGSYGFAMGQNWVGTVDVAYSLKNIKFGSIVSSSGVTSEATVKQHYSASFAPGYRVRNDGLLYAKVSLHSMTGNYTTSSGIDFSRTHSGLGVGLGYAMALSSNVELRAELENVNYSHEQNNTSTTATFAPKQTNVSAALLYKF